MTAALLTFLLASVGQTRVEPEGINASFRGKRIVVEGVLSGAIGTGATRQLRLLHSKAKFLPERRQEIPLKGNDNIEITGFVRVEGNDVLVDIQSLKILTSDVERYEERALELDDRNPHGWYELSDWARQRAQKYPNEDLTVRSQKAYLKGIQIERRNAAGNAEALRRLAQKVQTDKRVKDFDTAGIEHEILHAELTKIDGTSPEMLRDFSRRLRDRLPFRERTEMQPLEANARAAYEQDPFTLFAARDEAGRGQLARYWQVSLLVQAQNLLYKQKQKDALALAELAAQDMPDYPEFERTWIERAREDAMAKIDSLSRRDIELVAHSVAEKLQRPEDEKKLLSDWLTVQERLLREQERGTEQKALAIGSAKPLRDARRRYELAQNYVDWFDKDEAAQKQAISLLRECIAIDPQFVAAKSLLEQLGYRQREDGSWLNPEQGDETPSEQSGIAVRIGMTSEKVLSLLGEPEAKARIVTANQVQHLWTYHGIDETTYISFVQARDGGTTVAAIRRQ